MSEANPRAHLDRLIADRNYLGAQLFLKETELEVEERNELLGVLATAVVEELSRTRRDDRERLVYLRSLLAWILREVPGLGSLYREQLRQSAGRGDLISEFSRGLRNLSDVASGRKDVDEGVSEAAEDARRGFEDAAERFRAGESAEGVDEFMSAAEKGVRQGMDQLGAFFRALNEEYAPDAATGEETQRADEDVEDAEFTPENDEGDEIHVDRE